MGRVKELDGLRAIAILSVVAWHYLGAGDGPSSTPWRIFIVGRTGVDLFFVLSGYLITGILLANRGSSNYFAAFYGRRSFRILPIYFGLVAIYLAGRQLGGSARVLFDGTLPWWSYLIGLQNFWMAAEQTYGAYWLGGTWSLAIEEQFYLVFPLVIYFAPPRILPRLLIALLVLCPVGRMIAYGLGDRYGYYVLMPLRADILAMGALIAWLEFSGSISESVRRVFRVVFWSTACFFPIFAWVIENSTSATRCGVIPIWLRFTDRPSSWCWISETSLSETSLGSHFSGAAPRLFSPVFHTRSISRIPRCSSWSSPR